MSKGETYLIRRTAGEKPGELIRVPDELVVLASASQRRAAEDVAIQANSRDLLFVLFRHLRKSLVFFGIVFGLAFAAAVLLPSSYKSTAALLVRLGPESMLPDPSVQIGKAVVAPIQTRAAEINTELQILRSREVAEAVIARLGPGRILAGAAAAPMAKLDSNDEGVQAAVLLIDRKLEVEVEPDSNVLKVSFESKNAQVARDVVNTYVEEFRAVRAGIYRNPITAQFFGDQQEHVRRQIAQLEAEIRQLKDATGVADLKEQRGVLIARLARIQTDIDTVRNQLGATNAMENHPAMQRLRTLEMQRRESEAGLKQINELETKLAALERDFGVKSETFKQYATIAQQAGVDKAMSDGKLSNISIVQAASLPINPVKPDRKLLLGVGLFLALSGAIGLAFVAEAIDHTVKRPEDMTLMGVQRSVSIPLIAALQKQSGSVKVEQLPAAKTAAAAGLVQPRAGFASGPWSAIDPTDTPPAAPDRDVIPAIHENHHPVSWFHDLRQGVRRLAERVLTGTAIDGTSPRVIALIGARQNQGATTVACATAALLAERVQHDALQGAFDEVLLIDADLHSPTLHRQLGIDPSPGLTDWLADPTSTQLPLEAAIKSSPVEGLAVMPAGALRGGALTPNRLKRLIDIVAPNYRYVVIDLPPLDESPEAARLAAVCDGTVLVIEAEQLRKQVVVETLQTLQEAGVHVLGAVLNKRTYPVPEWLYERVETMAEATTDVQNRPGRSAVGAAARVIFTFADQAVVSGASFLCGVIVARFTSKEQFGLYGLGMTLVMIAAELQSAIVSTPQTVFGPKYDGERNRQFQGSMLVKLLLLAFVNAALLAIGSLNAKLLGKPDLSNVMAALAVGVTALHLWTFSRVAFFAHLRPGGALLVDTICCLCQLAALWYLKHNNLLSAWTAWGVITLMALAPALGFLVYWKPKMHFSFAGAKEDFRITWHQTRWILASSILWVGGMHLYPWVIEVFAERSEVATWTACFAVAAIGNPLMYGVMNMLGPQIAHRHAALPISQFQIYAWRATVAFVGVMSLFALSVTMLANWLMVHIYGQEYGGHTLIVALLAFGLVARVPGFVASRGLFVLQRADLELINNIAPLAILLILGVILTQRYGAAGAAFSLLVAQIIGSVSRMICFARCAGSHAHAEANEVGALGVQS